MILCWVYISLTPIRNFFRQTDTRFKKNLPIVLRYTPDTFAIDEMEKGIENRKIFNEISLIPIYNHLCVYFCNLESTGISVMVKVDHNKVIRI